MTYQEYIAEAESCTTPAEADAIINLAADDYTLSARQYLNIRYIALDHGYNF